MTSLDFAAAARRMADAARQAGHGAPGFRSPPRSPGCRRSIRRRRSGEAVIAVLVKGRPIPAVLADMVDGVVVANELVGAEAADLREVLWIAVADLAADLAADVGADVAADSPSTGTAAEVRAIRAA